MTTELVCADGVELLIDYLEGALDPQEREAIDTHLALCPRCVAFVKSYRETPRIFRQATLTQMPKDLQQDLLAVLRSKLGPKP